VLSLERWLILFIFIFIIIVLLSILSEDEDEDDEKEEEARRWRLADNAEDIILAHDQVAIAFDFDLGAAVLADEDFVALLDGELDELAVVITLSGAEGDNFAFLRFFLGGIRDDNAAFLHFRFFERLNEHAIPEGTNVNCHGG
jgi:hypothetical protein